MLLPSSLLPGHHFIFVHELLPDELHSTFPQHVLCRPYAGEKRADEWWQNAGKGEIRSLCWCWSGLDYKGQHGQYPIVCFCGGFCLVLILAPPPSKFQVNWANTWMWHLQTAGLWLVTKERGRKNQPGISTRTPTALGLLFICIYYVWCVQTKSHAGPSTESRRLCVRWLVRTWEKSRTEKNHNKFQSEFGLTTCSVSLSEFLFWLWKKKSTASSSSPTCVVEKQRHCSWCVIGGRM